MAIEIHLKVKPDKSADKQIILNEKLTCTLLNRLFEYFAPALNRMNQELPIHLKAIMLTNLRELTGSDLTNRERQFLCELIPDISKLSVEILKLEIENNKPIKQIVEEETQDTKEIVADAINKMMKH